MLNAARNAPTVAGARFKCLSTDAEAEVALHQIAGLLMGMSMARQYTAFAQPELCHESPDPVSQCLSLNPIQRWIVAAIASFLEHARDVFVCCVSRIAEVREYGQVQLLKCFTNRSVLPRGRGSTWSGKRS